jgi:hypothetical protein
LQLLDIDDPDGPSIKVPLGEGATEERPIIVEAVIERSGIDEKEWTLIKHQDSWLGRPREFWKERLLKDRRIRSADDEEKWEEPDAYT